MVATVLAVSLSPTHRMRKNNHPGIYVVQGIGVEGDAHAGTTVKHRSRVRQNPNKPNLRQVHLIHSELFDELQTRGYAIEPGRLGENITTRGIDLLALPTGTRLRIGQDAILEVTGLRNPCVQMDEIQPGLMNAVLERDASGGLVRKAGIMSIVVANGSIVPGDPISIELPAEPHRPLVVV